MSVISNNQLAGAAGQGGAAAGYQIDRSLRFNSGDSTYLSRTPSSAGNSKTWTLSFWIKRAGFGTANCLFMAYNGSSITEDNYATIEFSSNDTLRVGYAYASYKQTARVFRDPSAWYHIVIAIDTTNSTAGDRVQIYVNGIKETTFNATHDPDLNQDLAWNKASFLHRLCSEYNQQYSNAYLAEVHFCDGQALAPTEFGEYDGNNVWQPKEFEGSYNTDGYTVSGGAYYTGTSWALALNGSTTGRVMTYSTTSTTATFSPGITWSSQVRIYGVVYGSGYCKVNGGSNITGFGTSLGWVDVTSQVGSSGTLTSLTVGDVGQNYFALYAIELDGTILNVPEKGVNGFHLDFADNSSNAALGTDSSGNNNDWTVNNLSVASGAGTDSLIDTPSNYTAGSGNNAGNYATLNPLDKHSDFTTSNGNLDVVTSGSSWRSIRATIGISSGKHYWEFTTGHNRATVGISTSQQAVLDDYVGNNSSGWSYLYDGNKYHASSITSYGSSYAAGDTIGVAFDADAGNIYFYKNGTVQNSGTAAYTGLTSGPYFPTFSFRDSGNTFTANFGQRAFKYTPPTGYVSLCTTNLPDPTIADGSTAMDVKTFNANNGNSQSITLEFSPDLVWTKSRSNAYEGQIFDIVRGDNQELVPSSTAASRNLNNSLTFDSSGFTMPGSNNNANYSTGSSVAWAWDGGSSTSSNSDGSITSSVRANPSAGFSIVKFTNASGTVGHGLNSPPELILTKDLDATYTWSVYSKPTTKDAYLALNSSQASSAVSGMWGSNEPTSTVFGTTSYVAPIGDELIAYCFAPVEGYSAFGKYTGNGLADGPFVYTGFRPRFLLVKTTANVSGNWYMLDTERDPHNVMALDLYANDAAAESTVTTNQLDILSNGFKLRGTGAGMNGSNHTLIYAAFAEHPFKTSRAR